MGYLDEIRGRGHIVPVADPDEGFSSNNRLAVASNTTRNVAIASVAALDNDDDIRHTYDNRNITFSGDLADYDFDAILRDKQRNIVSLYQLADYYVDKDPIIRGIIKGVYSSFSVTPWKLIGESEQVKEKYEAYYKRINLRDRMASIFYQYFKYGNVYIYLQDDGNIITLPVNKCRISNIMVNGEPVVEFDAQSVETDMFLQGTPGEKLFIDDDKIDVQLTGLPPEVTRARKDNAQWVQLDPEKTFVLQDLKEDWMRYAVPMIAACLTGLRKKALIEAYEDSLLNLGINSFILAKYGNPTTVYPNKQELAAVQNVFRRAMRGTALAVTNNWVEAEVIQADTKDLFQFDKYRYVNSEILSAGGISGIIVSGRTDDGSTFASAQVSINTADKRIELARSNFCELMNKINRRVNGFIVTRSKAAKVPEFTLEPIDLSGNAKFQKVCLDLWKQGCMSTESMLSAHGIDFGQEVERKTTEIKDGTYKLLTMTPQGYADTVQVHDDGDNSGSNTTSSSTPTVTEEVHMGRPEVSLEERTSDIGNAITGKQPKPSNPEGSMTYSE